MSRKKRSNHTTERGHPNSAVSFLLSNDAYDMLCVSGYTRLADSPEIQMAAGCIADLMGSMTIHLTITMPHGQTDMTYKAKVVSGAHKLRGKFNGKRYYYGLQVQFQPLAPQREPD